MVEIGRPAVAEWTFPRGAGSVLLMIRFAEDHGVPAADVLRGSALTESALARPHAQIDAHQELAVVRNLVAALPERPVLGLEVGFRYRVTTFGIFGFACVSSPTVRDMISFALRYWDLSFAFCIPVVHVDDDEFRWELRDDRVPADVRTFLVQRDMSAMFKVMTDLLPEPLRLRRLQLRFPEPEGWPYDTFGVRPRFDAPDNIAAIDVLHLDQPLPQGDEHTVALCEAQCRDLVARNRARTGIAHEVRDRLIKVGGAATMDEVARALTVSPRTLRRKLDDAGTSYRALLDEVRETLAEEMLATGALSVHDVALRLGYAEASSFIYAFKRWKGATPAAYVRDQRG